MVLHGPAFGAEPGSRPWHHEYTPGDGPPDIKSNNYDWRKHPRAVAPVSEEGE